MFSGYKKLMSIFNSDIEKTERAITVVNPSSMPAIQI